MKKMLAACAFCLFSAGAFAQNDTTNLTRLWSLQECVNYALSNNLDVQRSQYNLEGSEIDQDVARFAMVPSLNAGVTNGYNWGRSINPVTNQFTTQEISSLSPNVNSSVTLFNGLRIQNTIRQANKNVEASEQDLLKAKNDVTLNVINLFINVIFNKELLANAQLQLASSQQQLQRTTKQVEVGALPKSDQLNLEAQVATNELNVINGENALNLSVLQLKQAMLLPASEQLDVAIPEVGVEDLIVDQSSGEIFNIARQTMPEIKSAELRVSSSYYAVRAAKGNLYPRLSLSGSINSNYSSANDRPQFVPDGEFVQDTDPLPMAFFEPTTNTPIPAVAYGFSPTGTFTDGYGYMGQLSDNLFRQVGLTLSIPLFNGLQAKAGVRRAVINQQIAEINSKQQLQLLRQNVETAYNDAFAASKSYNSSLKQVQAREEAYRMTKERYDLGAANYVEYQVAENDLFQARSDLARAKYNFIFRKKLLDFYQGKPIGL